MSTWRQLISMALVAADETWGDVVARTITDDELDVEFDQGYGSPEGIPFTLWTELRVYFPCEYDGSERVKSAPRSPCDEKMEHV